MFSEHLHHLMAYYPLGSVFNFLAFLSCFHKDLWQLQGETVSHNTFSWVAAYLGHCKHAQSGCWIKGGSSLPLKVFKGKITNTDSVIFGDTGAL
jgi:hypothetical protein